MPEIGTSSLMSGDWKRSYGANGDTGIGRKLLETVKPRKPTATTPVVDSTPEPLLMRAGQLQLLERRVVGAQFVGHQQFRHKPSVGIAGLARLECKGTGFAGIGRRRSDTGLHSVEVAASYYFD
jgi:hypothetical protein